MELRVVLYLRNLFICKLVLSVPSYYIALGIYSIPVCLIILLPNTFFCIYVILSYLLNFVVTRQILTPIPREIGINFNYNWKLCFIALPLSTLEFLPVSVWAFSQIHAILSLKNCLSGNVIAETSDLSKYLDSL